MAIPRRQEAGSIYLTFKVIQFINHFRRRLKSRVSGPAKELSLGCGTCLGLESKTIRSIEKGLARVDLQQRKKLHHFSNKVCKNNRKNSKPALKLQTATGRRDSAHSNTSAEQVQQTLKNLDAGNISPAQGSALSAVASDDNLFLKQNDTTNFEGCSLNETIQYLVVVYDAISVLHTARSKYSDQWLIAQGQDIGLDIDEQFIANYEHLLLRLQAQLISTLTRKVIEALLEGGQDKTKRKLLGWFTEFPDNRPPLSTTWPWSIKPSLAVLWGVCWMFYYPQGEQGTEKGNPRVPGTRFLQEFAEWNTPQPNEYLRQGLELIGTQTQPALQQPHSGNSRGAGGGDISLRPNIGTSTIRADGLPFVHPDLPDFEGDHVQSAPQHSSEARVHSHNRRNNRLEGHQSSGPIAIGFGSHAIPGPTPLADSHQNIFWSEVHASGAIAGSHEHSFCEPHIPGNATQTIFAFPASTLDINVGDSWQNFTQHSGTVTNLPQQASHLTLPSGAPAITISSDSEGARFTQPLEDFSEFIYHQAPQQPQAPPLQLDLNTTVPFRPPYSMGNRPPQDASPITTTIRHDRTPSLPSSMPTPVSISAPRSPLLSPTAGDRRHSIGSSHGHVRHASIASSSEGGDDANSPRRNYSYKRTEEPPRNRDGKMYCKHKDCTNLIFDRKCEWSKHMDKHDRPYKCNVKGCEKLQGFTYSGGLLRHEREVHKMHGGTKKSLFCPYPDCKRSSGSGFTRKENLQEHVRRVHRPTGSSADLGNLVIKRSDTQDDAAEIHLPESPYQRSAETPDEGQLVVKRKRMSDAGFSEEGDESDLRAEVKRLRAENEEKDSRLRQLEAAVMALQTQSRR